MKRPAFQFYPADWRKDLALRKCSLAARGMWVEIMCIAHECEPYGTLRHNGDPLQADDIAGLVGMCSPREAKALIDELVRKGVAKLDADGVLYSKRMVHDEQVRNARAEGGKAGAEHGAKGAEHGAKGGRPATSKGGGKGGSETPLHEGSKPPPSSSSSSSASAEDPHTPGKRGQVHGFPPGFDAFWSAYPRKTAKENAVKAFTKLRPDADLLARILAAVRLQAESEDWRKDRGRFVPHAATWLNGKRWEDQIAGIGDSDDIFAGAR